MNHIFSVFVAGFMMGLLVACLNNEGNASTPTNEAHGMTLSDMQIKITSEGHTATFRLYDTVAAKEFYDQLPLNLDLTNFRDAQWMFYPPQKLDTTDTPQANAHEVGTLAYYAPWGDVVMFYGRFGAAAGFIRWDMPYRETSIYRGCPA